MPEKNPDIWTQLWNWLSVQFANHNQQACGFVVGVLVSLTKSFRYGAENSKGRILAEAVLCGLIAYSSQPVWYWLGLPLDLVTSLGAVVGLIGTNVVRQFILKFINRKAGMNNEQL